MTTISQITNNDIADFTSYLIPFGSLDIRAAVEAAIESGHDARWAAEQVLNFIEQTDAKIDDIDPVYCVYDSILQEARQEIEEETGFDFMNDGAEIDTYGNCMCTQYDYKEEAKELLAQKVAEIETRSDNLQWFLDQIGIQL